MKTSEFITEMDCWDGYKKDGTQKGTGKNKGKRVNKCVPVKEDRDDRPLPDVNPIDVEITATLRTSYDNTDAHIKTTGELRNVIKADLAMDGWDVDVYIQGGDDDVNEADNPLPQDFVPEPVVAQTIKDLGPGLDPMGNGFYDLAYGKLLGNYLAQNTPAIKKKFNVNWNLAWASQMRELYSRKYGGYQKTPVEK